MQRLTIHLHTVVKTNPKRIKNTYSFIVSSQKQINHHLSMFSNIVKSYITNLK
jgi:hypothetical protein